MRVIGSVEMTKRFDFKKIVLVLAVFATFFVSNVVIACDQPDFDCPPANDCPVCAAYQELSSGDSSVHTIVVSPPLCPISTLVPAVVSGSHQSNHIAQPSSRAPPSLR